MDALNKRIKDLFGNLPQQDWPDEDDFDEDSKPSKDGRSRTWMVLLYPDNDAHMQAFEKRLPELDWNYAGALHDKDTNIRNELKKPHLHIVCLFKDGRKAADIAADLGLDGVRWLRAWDRQKKALRYLCHRDNSDKYQYSTEVIFGTVSEKAVAACSVNDQQSEKDSVLQIMRMLDEIDGFVTYKFFFEKICEAGLFSVFRRLGNMGIKLVDEHNYAVQREADEQRFLHTVALQYNQAFADYLCKKYERLAFVRACYLDDEAFLRDEFQKYHPDESILGDVPF